MLKKLQFVSLALFLSLGVTAREIQFSRDISFEYQQLIRGDLARLSALLQNPSAIDQQLLQVMELDELSASSLELWLTERLGHIVADDFDPLREFIATTSHTYQNAYIFPRFDEEVVTPLDPSATMLTVMANIGTAQYLIGKSQRQLYAFDFEAIDGQTKRIELTSPRVGVVKIGPGLFHPKLNFNSNDLSAEVNSIMRLATLFHEARHSDGNGETLGFFHAVCPTGHAYQGRSACDKNLNGPYMLDALLIEKFMASCQSCSAEELKFLSKHAADSRARVLTSYTVLDFTDDVKAQLEQLEASKQNYMAQWNTPNLSPRQEMMISNALESIDNKIARLMSSGAKVETVVPTTFWNARAE